MQETGNNIERIDFNKSSQYTLSIRLSADGFSFSIYNPIDNSWYCNRCRLDEELPLPVNVRRIMKEQAVFHHPYKQVNVLSATPRFTFTPTTFFEEATAEAAFYYNHPRVDNELLLFNHPGKADTVITFAMDRIIHQVLSEQFKNISFYSRTTLLLDFFLAKSRLGNCNKVYAYVEGDLLSVFSFERGKPTFINSFKCHSADDQAYYLLYVWKELNYSQERDELHLLGIKDDKEYLIARLKKFVQQVLVMNLRTEGNYLGDLKQEEVPADVRMLVFNG